MSLVSVGTAGVFPDFEAFIVYVPCTSELGGLAALVQGKSAHRIERA